MEQPLIIPVRREIWRPFYAGGVMLGGVLIAGSVAALRGSSVAVDVMIFIPAVVLAQASVRTAVWRLRPGRVTVTYDDSGLFVRRGPRLLRHYPWQDIEQVDVLAGYRRPEWSSAPLFAFLRVIWRDERAGADVSPEFLVVSRARVADAQQALQAVASRHLRTSNA